MVAAKPRRLAEPTAFDAKMGSDGVQFAVRSITTKYLNFAKRLREDPGFCRECEKFY